MHASLHELLSLRDEVVVDDAVVAHTRECRECRTELERLRTVTAELRTVPAGAPPPDRWAVIAAALKDEPEEQKKPGWRWPLAAAAAVLLTVTLLSWQGSGVNDSVNPPVRLASTDADEQDAEAAQIAWATKSRELEQVLAVLPEEPTVMRAGTALTLAELQDRIRWVDYRLALSEEAKLEPQQSELLWRERVDLLNSLVAVRYAQTRAPF